MGWETSGFKRALSAEELDLLLQRKLAKERIDIGINKSLLLDHGGDLKYRCAE